MQKLQGERDGRGGWTLTRKGRGIAIEMGTDTMAGLFGPTELQHIAEELGGTPQARIILMYPDSEPDEFEFRMATAVTKAMAEKWPILVDDHTGRRHVVQPPGVRRKP